MEDEPRRRLPPGLERSAMTAELSEPIKTEAQAQAYGGNVHALHHARSLRYSSTCEKPEPARRHTLAEIMDRPPLGLPPERPDAA